MNIVLVAGDFAQSEVLKMLGKKLSDLGHRVFLFLCYGKAREFELETMLLAIKDVQWLVAGMSN